MEEKMVIENEMFYSDPSMVNVPFIQQFQPALKPSAALVPKEVIEDGLTLIGFEKTISEWNVSPYIDEWADNVRMWVSKHVIVHILETMATVDKELLAQGLSHLTCENSTYVESLNGPMNQAPATIPQTNLFSTQTQQVPDKPLNLLQLQQKYGSSPIVQQRMCLERYLNFTDFNCRAYIVERIKALGKGSCLAQFQWDGGQKWKQKDWNHDDFPSDSYVFKIHLVDYEFGGTLSG